MTTTKNRVIAWPRCDDCGEVIIATEEEGGSIRSLEGDQWCSCEENAVPLVERMRALSLPEVSGSRHRF